VGLAKKILLADTLGYVADKLFEAPVEALGPSAAWLGIICYSFQIYFDFSGYSDMAIGLAKMMGFTFPENFKFSYLSLNITEFWKRWHITLGNFMREYLYIPLGGNRVSKFRLFLNLWIVFLISGIWRGAVVHVPGWIAEIALPDGERAFNAFAGFGCADESHQRHDVPVDRGVGRADDAFGVFGQTETNELAVTKFAQIGVCAVQLRALFGCQDVQEAGERTTVVTGVHDRPDVPSAAASRLLECAVQGASGVGEDCGIGCGAELLAGRLDILRKALRNTLSEEGKLPQHEEI
jgi:hypothetical protein